MFNWILSRSCPKRSEQSAKTANKRGRNASRAKEDPVGQKRRDFPHGRSKLVSVIPISRQAFTSATLECVCGSQGLALGAFFVTIYLGRLVEKAMPKL